MKNEALIIGKQILIYENENKDCKYNENKNQMSKYKYAKGFLIKYLRENGGKLQTSEKENDLNSGLTFTKNIICLTGVDLWRFANSLRFASSATIDTTTDGQVCVSITIPETRK